MIQPGRLQGRGQALARESTAGPLDRGPAQGQNLRGVRIGAARTPGPLIHMQKNLRPAAAEGMLSALVHQGLQLGPFILGQSYNMAFGRHDMGRSMEEYQCTPIITLQHKQAVTLSGRHGSLSSYQIRFDPSEGSVDRLDQFLGGGVAAGWAFPDV